MQVPPPPQAEGKNILLFPRVFNKVAPDDTLRSSCPFIFIGGNLYIGVYGHQ